MALVSFYGFIYAFMNVFPCSEERNSSRSVSSILTGKMRIRAIEIREEPLSGSTPAIAVLQCKKNC
jgi:hypothetical protein